ncbi:MAG TPA: type 1 glutamine amidotransferase [Acidimicrobiales bacterium]|nr:type 1 glutamine amidotransferase [Acidimicrobiales bacterium]
MPVPQPADAARRWIVVQHTATEGPGLLAGVLAEAGVPSRVVRLDRGEALPAPSDVAGVIVMGGPMGVHDTAEHPWLGAETRWLTGAVDAGLPVLGVCLGAQLVAAALGAAVTTGASPEIGIGCVTLDPEGRADPLLGPEGDRLPVVHWHGDTFAIPDGAVRLASSDRYQNQAFRYGDRVYGLQFHLEVDDEVAADWAPDLPAGISLDGPERRAVEETGRRVFGRFIDLASAADGD